MEPVPFFSITDMKVSGFKCFADNAEFHFDRMTFVTGGNGRGKSSIADAIAFAVTGVPFFGERSIDRLYSEQNPNLSITLRYLDANQQFHVLVRTRQKNRMDVTLDGLSIRQQDLNVLFGERDVFLSIFNPLYFIEELGDKGKELLERYLPVIPQEKILAEMGETEQAALQSESLLQPEVWMKNRRAEIRDLEGRITYLTGQKDLTAKQRAEAQDKEAELSQELEQLQEQVRELEERQFDGIDRAATEERILDLTAQHQRLSKEPPYAADTTELDKRLAQLRKEQEARSSAWYQPTHMQEIADADAQVKALLEDYKAADLSLKKFQVGSTCPTCLRSVTVQELPHLQEQFRTARASIKARGTAARGKWKQLKEQEEKDQAAFYADAQKAVEQMQGQIEKLEQERTALIEEADRKNAAHTEELDSLLNQIQNLSATKDCGILDAEELARLEELRGDVLTCSAQLKAVRESLTAPSADYDAQITEVRQAIQAKEELLGYVAAFVSKKAEMLFSALRMNRVEIRLYEAVKTTGLAKDVFKFTYNKRRYDRLSLSEKIRAGMEVSELMKRLTGRNYPQFVDNMESVEDLSNVHPTGQVIMAKCVHKAELSVKIHGQEQGMKQAA